MGSKRKTNGHSRPEDFLLPDVPEVEEVTLPSGLKVKLRSPLYDEFWLRAGDLPGFLLGQQGGEAAPAVDRLEAIEWSHRVVAALIAEPAFSMEPGPGEFHPRRLKAPDRAFLSEYYARHVGILSGGGGGVGLDKFRGQAGELAGDGPRGEKVRKGSQ